MVEVPAEPETEGSLSQEDPLERMVTIGMVVERFALLEYTLRRTARLLLSADPVAAHVLTVQESAQRLIDLCVMIIKESSRKGVDRATPELVAALDAARAVIRRRNDLLHNVQYPGDGLKMETWKYRRGEDLPIVIPAGLAEINALWSDANGVINQLMAHQPRPPFTMPEHYM